MNLASLRKVVLFGVLGAIGCVAGWLVGEPFLWLVLPSNQAETASLAAKPTLTPPAVQAAPPAPPPPAFGGGPSLPSVPPPPPPALVAVRGAIVPAAAPPEVSVGSAKPPPPPPAEFARRLQDARAKSGDVQITLIWFNVNDLDLHCIDPQGEEVFFARRRSRSGGELDVDMNAGGPMTSRPVENIYWPKGRAPAGKYKVFVNHYANHGGRDPTEYSVNVLADGTRKEFTGRISGRDPKRLICEFEVKPPGPELRLAVSPQLVIEKGGNNHLKVRVARRDAVGPVVARLAGDVRGITPQEFTLGAGETEATAEIAADALAVAGARVLAVHATAGTLTADTSFRLIVREPSPQLRLAVSRDLIVNQGGSNWLKVRVARSRLEGPVQIDFTGELHGILPKPLVIAAGESEATVELAADLSAAAGVRTITAVASADAVKAEAIFRLAVKQSPSELRVAVSPELVVMRGGSNRLQIRVARSDQATPVLVLLEGDVIGISPRTFLVRAMENETTADIEAGSAAAPGERTVKVLAKAGTLQTTTSFHLTIQEMPPRLRLALPDEIRISQGGRNVLPVRIARDRFTGPVLLRLKGTPSGVSPLEHTIAADLDDDEIALTAVGSAVGSAIGAHEIQVRAEGDGVEAQETFTLYVLTGAPSWSWRLILVIGLWTALLAAGLALSLVVGQNAYLARRFLSPAEFVAVLVGSLVAGVIAGGLGQTLYNLLNLVRLVPQVGFLVGWLLLGGLVGRGVAFFVPNLSGWRASAAGTMGGFCGAVAFIAVSFIGNVAGRFMGAAILGFAIGLMVALVETAFRRAWLEVISGRRSLRTVNLGVAPVVVGGDARKCTVVVPGSPGMALKFFEKQGQCYCLDVLAEKTYAVTPGYRHRLRDVELVVRANDGPSKARWAPPPKASTPAAPVAKPVVAKPLASPKAAVTNSVVNATKPSESPPPKTPPATPVAGRCPVCGQTATGVPGSRRCEKCFSVF